MCVFACVIVNVNVSVSVNASVNVRACQEAGLKLECLDGYFSPSTALDLASLSLVLSVRTTPLVPLATAGAVARVAQYVSTGLHHTPCATCHVPLPVLWSELLSTFR